MEEESSPSEILAYVQTADLDDPQEAREVAFSLLQNLSYDVIYLLFDFLDWKSLHALCQVSAEFYELCKRPKFRKKIEDGRRVLAFVQHYLTYEVRETPFYDRLSYHLTEEILNAMKDEFEYAQHLDEEEQRDHLAFMILEIAQTPLLLILRHPGLEPDLLFTLLDVFGMDLAELLPIWKK